MWEYNYTNELYHHGVKGMKWGHRRASYNEAVSTARANKKAAYKSFNKSFNKSYGYDYTHSLRNLVSKKSKDQSKSNWAKTTKAADKYNKAKAAYKTAKKENKQAIKNQTEKLNKQASFGEKLMYNNATRKRAAQYVVNKNMSVSEATKKAKGDAWKNAAALIGTYAAVGVGVAVYNKNH